MGVRELTSYIEKNYPYTLKKFRLQNCAVLIDGNNILKYLYRNDGTLNSSFCGEYDKYAAIADEFFET